MLSTLTIIVLALTAAAFAVRCRGLAIVLEEYKQERIASEVKRMKNPDVVLEITPQ
jgi:hypothetical protein